MIEWLLYGVSIAIFLLCIALHELGHRKMAWRLGYKSEIRWEKKPGKLVPDIITVWDGEPNEEHEQKILIAGLMAGFVPIVFMIVLFDYFGILVLMNLILYFIVSRKDFARYFELVEIEED